MNFYFPLVPESCACEMTARIPEGLLIGARLMDTAEALFSVEFRCVLGKKKNGPVRPFEEKRVISLNSQQTENNTVQ